jgi:hypothetical protein
MRWLGYDSEAAFFSRFQEGDRCGAGHMATFEQLATNQVRRLVWAEKKNLMAEPG